VLVQTTRKELTGGNKVLGQTQYSTFESVQRKRLIRRRGGCRVLAVGEICVQACVFCLAVRRSLAQTLMQVGRALIRSYLMYLKCASGRMWPVSHNVQGGLQPLRSVAGFRLRRPLEALLRYAAACPVQEYCDALDDSSVEHCKGHCVTSAPSETQSSPGQADTEALPTFLRGRGEETERRFISFSFSKSADKSYHHWERLLWSFRVLETGLWPAVDYRGQPIVDERAGTPLAEAASGIRFTGVVLFAKGDLEYFANEVGTTRTKRHNDSRCYRPLFHT
jgi:hypothetical protein